MTNHDEHPEMQGQAQKKRKTERQGQAQKQAAGVLEDFEEDEVNDDPPEGPNFDTRPWFWAHRLPTKKAAPMPPFENVAAQRPEGARLPSVGLVLFLEAMTDLIGQINVENAEEEWNSEYWTHQTGAYWAEDKAQWQSTHDQMDELAKLSYCNGDTRAKEQARHLAMIPDQT